MDFELTEKQKRMQGEVREFLEGEIAPIANERDQKGPLTREELVGFIKQLMPFGYYNGMLPKELGGKGLDSTTMALLIEELGRVWSGLAGSIWIASSITAFALASPTHKDRYLPRILDGDVIGCAAITEPDAGSNAAALKTYAVRDGDEWVLNGTKTWISNGSIADVVNVLAITDSGQGSLGISMMLVDREVSPFEHRELHKIGWRAFPTAELVFKDCRVPTENAAGARQAPRGGDTPRSGYQTMMAAFESARATMSVLGVGICQAALDASLSYVKQREQYGRPIGGFQMVQEMIADMITETDAARFLTYRAWQLIDQGRRARMESSIAKGYACEAAVRVALNALKIHGAMGLDERHPVQRYLRDARTLTIPDGTTQIQKLVIGREAIGIRAFD
jgi:alkylation response protein AidB-like acyl-CoA dehydrogenase